MLGGGDLGVEVVEGFDQKTAGAAGGVKHSVAQVRVGHLHHEAHHGARSVELAAVARRVAHFAQHGFVQMREGVDFLAGVEVDAVDLVDDVAQQIAADHAVLHTLEHVCNDFALAAFFTLARQGA